MTDASRRAYLGLGRAFVAIGGIVALGSVADRALGWGFFRASPLGTAGFLVLVGALLLWTVRQADAGTASAEAAAEANAGAGADEADGIVEAAAATPALERPDPDVDRP